MSHVPEDDPDFIPEMPENYGAGFFDPDNHRDIETMTEAELSRHDIKIRKS